MRFVSASGPTTFVIPGVNFTAAWYSERIAFVVSDNRVVVKEHRQAPVQTSRGFVNEKGCSHINFRGNIFIAPKTVMTDTSSYDYPYGRPNVKSGPTKWYVPSYYFPKIRETVNRVITLGESFSRSLPDVVSGSGSIDWEYNSAVATGTWDDARTFTVRSRVNVRMKWRGSWRNWETHLGWTSVRFNSDYTRVTYAMVSEIRPGKLTHFDLEPVVTYTDISMSVMTCSWDPFGIAPPSLPLDIQVRMAQPSFTPIDWGDLAAVAADDAKALNINSSAFLYQLKDLIGSVRTFKKALKKPSPKTWSKAYLAWKYGVDATRRDVQEILHAVQETLPSSDRWSIVRSQKELGGTMINNDWFIHSDHLVYKIFYRPNPCHTLEKSLRDWDFWLSSENIWDLIPWSFVVDWMTDLSQIFEFHDRQQYYDTVDVLGVTKSRRTDYSFMLRSSYWTVTQPVSIVLYDRWTQHHADVTYLLFKAPGTFHNWAEGAALILSKSRV